MIAVNELRVGNYVMDRGNKILSIDRIVGYKIECDVKNMPTKTEHGLPIFYHPYTEYFEHLQPIPLTEEWLVKFGFITETGWDDMIFWVIPLESNNRDRFELFETESGYELPSGTICKYVHQLQNAYCCHYFTGQELTLKQ